MKYQDLITSNIKEVILEHGNNSLRRDIKVITDKELLQYEFDKIIGHTAYYIRKHASKYI